jgi:hypothetical protein
MADIESKYAVTVAVTIADMTSGQPAPFSDMTAVYHDCSREVMHAIESAVGEALIELGDQGIVMLGGEAGAAVLEAQAAAKDKVRGKAKK